MSQGNFPEYSGVLMILQQLSVGDTISLRIHRVISYDMVSYSNTVHGGVFLVRCSFFVFCCVFVLFLTTCRYIYFCA